MLSAFFITFRESLEAAVVISILISILNMSGDEKAKKFVWQGTILGIFASFALAWIMNIFLGGFEGIVEKIYEGVLMITAAGLLTNMIIWIRKNGRLMRDKIKNDVKVALSKKSHHTILLLAFLAVAREGIETVIFFKSISFDTTTSYSAMILGGILGIMTTIIISMMFFYGVKKANPAKILKLLTYILIFIAGGLLAHGIVEFQGAGVFPTFIKPLFDLSDIFSEKEGLGAILKSLFGYDANPSLLAVIGYLTYLGINFRLVYKKK